MTLLSLCGWCITASRRVQLRRNRTDHVRGNTHGPPVLRARSSQTPSQCFPPIALHVGATISASHMREARGRPGDPHPTPWTGHSTQELQRNKTTAVGDEGLAPTPPPPPARSQDTLQKGREKSRKGRDERERRKGRLRHQPVTWTMSSSIGNFFG